MIKIETVGKPYMRYLAKVIPLAFDESMSYYEFLCNVYNYLKNEVAPVINNNAEALEELRLYVENYFDNLDIQEEVDNKLEEMYENGQLATLVTQFLQLQALFVYNTVSEMVASENLANKSIAKTLNFNEGDNGGAYYKIRTITNEDTVNNISLFAITNDETLVAELIPEPIMNTSQFGFENNEDVTDNFEVIADYINNNLVKELYINKGTYILSDKIEIENVNNITIKGEGTISNEIHDNNCLEITNCNNVIIEDINLYSTYQYSNVNESNKRGIIRLNNVNGFEIRNIKMEHINSGLIFTDCENGKIYNNYANDCKTWAYMFGEYGESYDFYDNDNLEIFNNISNNCSDGIKLTGYISNILIHDNISKNNVRDGIDYAGFSVKEISIYNNLLINNTVNGLEFKHLIRPTYTPDPEKDLYFKNINIYNNKFINNLVSGIEFHGYYNDDDQNYNIIVKNNEVIYDLPETNTNVYGISIQSNTADVKNALIISSNIIKGNYRHGLQLRNSNHTLIEDNIIEKTQRGSLRLNYSTDDYSNYGITMNDIIVKNNEIAKSTNAGCIMGDNTENITNGIILNNTFDYDRTTGYPITNIDETGIKILVNFGKTPEATTPTGRSFKNVVTYSSDTATTKCIGWIATTSNATATFKKYIDLS